MNCTQQVYFRQSKKTIFAVMDQIIESIIYIIMLSTLLVSGVARMDEELRDTWIGHPHSTYFKGEWYRLLSAGLIQVDFLSLFLNLYVFHSFASRVGYALEASGWGRWSGVLFLLLYLGGILSANLVLLWQYRRDPYYYHLGAYAGIRAVAAAAIAYFPFQRIGFFLLPISFPGVVLLALYLLGNLLAKNSVTGKRQLDRPIAVVYGIVFVACLRWRVIVTFVMTSLQAYR